MKKSALLIGKSVFLMTCILLGVFLINPATASAQTVRSNANSCQQYLQNLAKQLYVPAGTLAQNSVAENKAIVSTLVQDHKMTSAQGNTIEQNMQPNQKCVALTDSAMLRNALQSYQSIVLSQLGSGLKLSSSQLHYKLQHGQALAQIAKAQNVSTRKLQTAVLNAVTSVLSQDQNDGNLTQQQVNYLAQYAQRHSNDVISWLNTQLVQKQ